MKFIFNNKKPLIMIGAIGALVVGFQNCSNIHFEKDPYAADYDMQSELMTNDGQTVPIRDAVFVGGDGQQTPVVEDSSNNQQDDNSNVGQNGNDQQAPTDDVVQEDPNSEEGSVVSNPTEEEPVAEPSKPGRDVASEHGNGGNSNSGHEQGGPVVQQPQQQEASSDDVIECYLPDSKKFVALADKFRPLSNQSSTRVCMSSNACLTLVNNFVSQRGGTLEGEKVKGKSKISSNGGQCTKVFQGSKGTCHNATVLTDAQVAQILSQMSQ